MKPKKPIKKRYFRKKPRRVVLGVGRQFFTKPDPGTGWTHVQLLTNHLEETMRLRIGSLSYTNRIRLVAEVIK